MSETLQGIETSAMGETAKRVVVDLGSGVTPAAIHFRDFHRRKLQPGELRIGVDNDAWRAGSTKADLRWLGQEHPVVVASALNLPFADNSVDELIFNNFFRNPDISTSDKIFNEATRVLRTGGGISIRDSYSPAYLLNGDWGDKVRLEQFLTPYSLRIVKFEIKNKFKVSDGLGVKKDDKVLDCVIDIELEKV